MEPDAEFVGVTRGLLFKGHILAYDPTYNVTEWVPVCRTAAVLSPTEDSLAWELSNITLLEVPDNVPRMEHSVNGTRGPHWLKKEAPSPQAHPRPVEQGTDEEMARDPGASAVEDGHAPESLVLGEPMVDSSLIEKDAVVEEPMVEVPPTREEPATECPALVCSWPLDSQEEDQVEVHTPKEDLNYW